MQNNTPFSRDLTPDLTRTILSVVKEGLLGKLKKKVSRFGQGLRDVGGDGPASPSDRLRIARWDRAHRTEGDIQRAHMKHKARATVKEEQEYIERLEFALESIAEELECSVEDLLEDIQTPDRAAQSRNIVGDAVDRANNSETDRQDKIRNRKLTKVSNRHEMERKSKKTYGMGGKIVKKA